MTVTQKTNTTTEIVEDSKLSQNNNDKYMYDLKGKPAKGHKTPYPQVNGQQKPCPYYHRYDRNENHL